MEVNIKEWGLGFNLPNPLGHRGAPSQMWCVWSTCSSPEPLLSILRSFSLDDGDGSENLTLKMNSRFFKLCRAYSSSLKMSNVGEFSWSSCLKDPTQVLKEKTNSLSLVYVLHKREIRDFHAVVVQWRPRNVQNSVLHVQSCCFANQTYCFFDVLATDDAVVVKAPYYVLNSFLCRQEELPGIAVKIYVATYHCVARRSWVTGRARRSLDTLSSSGSCWTLLKLKKGIIDISGVGKEIGDT